MKKLLLLVTFAILFAKIAICQDSLGLQGDGITQKYIATQLIVIKGEEIRRFPSANFLDAVNGLFPWVFSQTPDANSFLFIVNGFLLADINSISLNDIEEVTFSRAFNGSLYPFSKAGTFYITTRKANAGKSQFNFNSQYNVIGDKTTKRSAVISPDIVVDYTAKKKVGYLFSNQASLLAGGKKWDFYGSAQLDHLKNPYGISNTTTTYIGASQTQRNTIDGTLKRLNFRLFAQLSYRFSSKLAAGITGGYFNSTTNSDTVFTTLASNNKIDGTKAGKANMPYYNAAAFIHWAPLKNLSNRLSFEYAHDKLTDNTEIITDIFDGSNPLFTINTVSETILHNKRWMFRDELAYTFISTTKFEAGVSTVFSYVKQAPEYSNTNSTISNSGTSINHLSLNNQQPITTLNPKFYFSYNNVITGHAGYGFILNKGISNYTSGSRSNPYACVLFNIKNVLKKGTKLGRLDFSVNYSDLTRNNSNSNWLPGIATPSQFIPFPIISLNISPNFTGGIVNPSLANVILKNRLIAVQANAAFLNNKLLVGAEWSQLKADIVSQIVYSTGQSLVIKGKQTQQGVSAYLAAKLIDQPIKNWLLRLNVLLPTVKYKFDSFLQSENFPPSNQMQLGLQNNFVYKKWYGQLNGLAALNNKTYNTFLLNYVLVGYNFNSPSAKFLQKFSMFVQGRNLLSSKEAKNYLAYYIYGGGGINISL